MLTVKIRREGSIFQCYRRDQRGWFKSGWGWSLEKVAAFWEGKGYRVVVGR